MSLWQDVPQHQIPCALGEEVDSTIQIINPAPQLRGMAITPDDRRFIESCINNKTPEEITDLLSEYRQRWLVAANKETKQHCKDNTGRFAANTWLRLNT